jgi:hypothetical protein
MHQDLRGINFTTDSFANAEILSSQGCRPDTLHDKLGMRGGGGGGGAMPNMESAPTIGFQLGGTTCPELLEHPA